MLFTIALLKIKVNKSGTYVWSTDITNSTLLSHKINVQPNIEADNFVHFFSTLLQ